MVQVKSTWLLLKRTWVKFLAPIWLTTSCNSSSGVPAPTLASTGLHIRGAHKLVQANMHAHKKIKQQNKSGLSNMNLTISCHWVWSPVSLAGAIQVTMFAQAALF